MASSDRSFSNRRGQLRGLLLVLLLALGTILTANSSASGAEKQTLPSNVNLEQWETSSDGAWTTGALQGNNSDYSEGEVVPFRLTIPAGVDPGQYQFSVCREYLPGDDSPVRGYLRLQQFDTDRPAEAGGTVSDTEGAFSAVNASFDAVTDGLLGDPDSQCDEHEGATSVEITKAEGVAYILWGGRLAAPSDAGVGAGHGASSFSGGSLHMRIGTPDKAVGIQVGAIIPEPEPATLSVIKHVINDNGGTKTAADFTMNVTGINVSQTSFPGSESGVIVTLDAGTYAVDEAAVPGYTKTLSAGCSGTIPAGETATCTISNDDQPASLTVIKHVINDSVGTKTAADFTMKVSATNVSDASFAGSETGVTVTLDAGAYSVDEDAVAGYTMTLGPDCSGTLAPGGSATCTITNDDIAPGTGTLTVVKVEQALLGANSWEFALAGPTTAANRAISDSGSTTWTGLTVGSYSVTELNGNAGVCDPSSQVASFVTSYGPTNVPGVASSGATMADIAVVAGQQTTVYFFNQGCAVASPSTLIIQKFEDPAADRTGTTGLAGWQFNVSLDGTALAGSPFTTPAGGGPIVIPGLNAGAYLITELAQSGWESIGYRIDQGNDGSFETSSTGTSVTVNLGGDADSTRTNFYNRGRGTLVVEKTTVRNGLIESAQNGGWTIAVSSADCNYSATANTVQGNPKGTAEFEDVPVCTDYVVTEDADSKPALTPAFAPLGAARHNGVQVRRGETTTVEFVNAREDDVPTATPTQPAVTPTATNTPLPPRATPTSSPPPPTASPTATPTEQTAVAGVSPEPPSSGTGTSGGGTASAALLAGLVAIAVAAGLAGLSAARRNGS